MLRKSFLKFLLLSLLPLLMDYQALLGQADPLSIELTTASSPNYALIYEESLAYLQIIRDEFPDLLNQCKKFQTLDIPRQQKTFYGDDVGWLPPLALRYIKIAGDLRREFGDLLKDMHVVEIGGLHPGLQTILEAICQFKHYSIVDHQSPRLSPPYDLVIAVDAFSSMKPTFQNFYLEKIIKPTSRGYIVQNLFSQQLNTRRLSIEYFVSLQRALGRKGCIHAENWRLNNDQGLIIWKPATDETVSKLKDKPNFVTDVKSSAITYSLSGGRLGDNLLAYFQAKWAAMEYGIPFLYRPFPFSDRFSLHGIDPLADSQPGFPEIITIFKKHQIDTVPTGNLLVIPYFPYAKWEHLIFPGLPNYPVHWDDPKFLAEIVACLAPSSPIETITIPKDCISVAVHVRRGGGVDDYPAVSYSHPLKFPPDSYYIEQIQTVARLFPNQVLYVYIFTDDHNPSEIAKRYAATINNPLIVFDWNKDQSNDMFRDFYSIGKFDCLIRPMSNFSIIAALLGHYEVLITPTNCHITNGVIVIDKIELTFKPRKGG